MSTIFELETMIVSPEPTNIKKKEVPGAIPREKGIAATSGLINFVCGMIGPGCFSLAMSFKQAGLWAGLFLAFFIGFLSQLSMHKLVNCSQFLAKVNGDKKLDYGDMAEQACKRSYPLVKRHASLTKTIVNFCILAFQSGVLSVNLVFAAEHIIEIWEYIAGSPPPFSKVAMILVFFVPQLLLNLIGHIKIITVLCLCGNVIIFAAIGLITMELLQHQWYPTSSLPAITNMEGVSLAAGAFIYSFEGQAMVLPLENSLKRGNDMGGLTGVLTTGLNLVTILYAFLGFFGYVTFGPNVADSLTLNLPNSMLSVTIKILLVLKMFFGSALQLFVIVEMLLPLLYAKIPEDKKVLKSICPYATRIALMLFALLMAVLVPNLMQIIPLVGITSGMLISLILPSFLDAIVFLPVFTKEKRRGRFIYNLSENVFLFLLGWTFMASGLYSTILSIKNS